MKKLLWLLPLVLLLVFLTRERPYRGPKHTVDLTATSFAAEVADGEGTYAVDFWATWCGPCRHVEGTLEVLAGEYGGRMPIGKLDIDQHPDIARKYGVSAIPTLIVFRGGREIDRRTGVASEAEYRAWFDGLLADAESREPAVRP